MRLFSICTDCKNEISMRTWATTRVDLKMKHGDNIELYCKSCNKTDKYSIDDLKAKESKIAILIGLLILFIGTPISLILLWNYIWQTGLYSAFGLILIIGIPGFIYMIINKNDQNRVRIFNRS